MKIKNKTEWNTMDLMKLIRAVAKKEGLGIKYHVIRIIHSHRSVYHYYKYSGRASLGLGKISFDNPDNAEYGNGKDVLMRVPPFIQEISILGSDGKYIFEKKRIPFDSVSFAKVLTHEFGHNMGLLHGEMLPIEEIDCSWAKDFLVRQKDEISYPNPEKV